MNRTLLIKHLLGIMLIITTSIAYAISQPALEKAKLVVVDDNIKQIQKNMQSEQSKELQLTRFLQATEIDIGKVNKEIIKNQQEKDLLEIELSDLKKHYTEAKNSLSSQQKILEEELRTHYRLGQQSYIKLLINQENSNKVNRMLKYYNYLHQHRLQYMNNISQTLNLLNISKNEIEEKTQKLALTEQALIEDKQQIETQQSKRKKLLEEIKQSLVQQSKKLARLKEDKTHLENTIIDLQKKLQAKEKAAKAARLFSLHKSGKFAQQKTKLSWPTEGVIQKRYGTPIEKNSDLVWNGALIKASKGEDVRSIYNGKVIFSGWMRGFGLIIIIDHGNEYMSLYGRNNTLFKEVGDTVKIGDLIAKVGQSGGYEESGLYFEIRHKGKPLNPELWCKRTNGHVKIG